MNHYTLDFREFIDVTEKLWEAQDVMECERTSFCISGLRSMAHVYVHDGSAGEKMFEEILHRLSIAYIVEPYELSCQRIIFLLATCGHDKSYELYESDAGIALVLDADLRTKKGEIKLQEYQRVLEKDFSVSIFYPVLLITSL